MIKKTAIEVSSTIYLDENYRIISGYKHIKVWFLGIRIWNHLNDLQHTLEPNAVKDRKAISGFGLK